MDRIERFQGLHFRMFNGLHSTTTPILTSKFFARKLVVSSSVESLYEPDKDNWIRLAVESLLTKIRFVLRLVVYATLVSMVDWLVIFIALMAQMLVEPCMLHLYLKL
ncbi:hypothetical protein VNO77_23759 [Canavalia gladiata]|uniref:Uncharacterized protein n=1 Tax=Canavalia gladiata TaxID=3824 RepID=A0AAN9L8C6_CANGL